jgi:hypothetical protein
LTFRPPKRRDSANSCKAAPAAHVETVPLRDASSPPRHQAEDLKPSNDSAWVLRATAA